MTTLSATASPDDDLEIIGSVEGLRRLVLALESGAARTALECDLRSGDHHVERIIIVVDEKLDGVTVADHSASREIEINGPRMKLQLLAQNVRFVLGNDSPDASDHMHVEFFPGHFYLSESSIPLQVQLI